MTPTIKYILVGLDLFTGNPERILRSDPATGVAVVRIESAQEERELTARAHDRGRCGGFERLTALPSSQNKSLLINQAERILRDLKHQVQRDQKSLAKSAPLTERPEIVEAVGQVQAAHIKETVQFMSDFPTRYNRAPTANEPVEALRSRLATLVQNRAGATVTLIGHSNTPQKSIRVRLPGTERPNEVVVFGGHLDSISLSMLGTPGKIAPGADDNASGTGSLIEALRVVLSQPATARTLEFFFYAGEESGLLGSAEIASDYKKRSVDVVSVLQLDMTLFPGSGQFVLGSMTDFTTPALRDYLYEANRLYVKATVKEDQCGYGCSDHASWYRQGYPTVMPFEAEFATHNRDIHSKRDTINEGSDFEHAAMFAKLAVVMALDLGSSTQRFN